MMETLLALMFFFAPIWVPIAVAIIFRKQINRWVGMRERNQRKNQIRQAYRDQVYLDKLAEEVAEEEGI